MKGLTRCRVTEEELAGYLSHTLPPNERKELEEHFASCGCCRQLLVEADEVLRGSCLSDHTRKAIHFIQNRIWAFSAVCFLGLSFIFHSYFLQFLTASLLAGAKAIMDSRAARLMIMIHKALDQSPESAGSFRNPEERTSGLMNRLKDIKEYPEKRN